jgi:hypothetical protein
MKINSWDNLKTLTKNEIISFLKEKYYFNQPTEQDINTFKYFSTSKKLLDEMDDHIKNDPTKNLASKRDKLAEIFNNSRDIDEKEKLIKQIAMLDKKILNHHNQWNSISDRMDKNEKKYKK